MAALPACLKLSLLQPLQGRSNRRQHGRAACQTLGRQRPLAAASAPTTARAGTTAPAPSKQRGSLNPQQFKQFDVALRADQLDEALAVLAAAAAAAAAGGHPLPLLGPDRNRALIQACFARGRPDRAVAYLRLLHPDVAPWPAVLKEANRRRDVVTLRRVLAARAEAGLPLDHRCATAAIAGYSGIGRLPDGVFMCGYARVCGGGEGMHVRVCVPVPLLLAPTCLDCHWWSQ